MPTYIRISRILLVVAAILLLEKEASAACRDEYSDASVHYQAPDGSPVVYQMQMCDGRYKKTYYDLRGRMISQSRLRPSVRHQLNEMFEAITGKDLDLNGDLDKQILDYAKAKGIVR